MEDTSAASPDSKNKKRRFSLGLRPKRLRASREALSSERNKRSSRNRLTTSTGTVSGPCPAFEAFDDRQRVVERYAAATELLQEAIRGHETIWRSLDWAELHHIQSERFDSQFVNKINHILDHRKTQLKDESSWEKCRHAINSLFIVFRPFAKNFLNIAQGSSQVNTPTNGPDNI